MVTNMDDSTEDNANISVSSVSSSEPIGPEANLDTLPTTPRKNKIIPILIAGIALLAITGGVLAFLMMPRQQEPLKNNNPYPDTDTIPDDVLARIDRTKPVSQLTRDEVAGIVRAKNYYPKLMYPEGFVNNSLLAKDGSVPSITVWNSYDADSDSPEALKQFFLDSASIADDDAGRYSFDRVDDLCYAILYDGGDSRLPNGFNMAVAYNKNYIDRSRDGTIIKKLDPESLEKIMNLLIYTSYLNTKNDEVFYSYEIVDADDSFQYIYYSLRAYFSGIRPNEELRDAQIVRRFLSINKSTGAVYEHFQEEKKTSL